jgi:hypothetical protein
MEFKMKAIKTVILLATASLIGCNSPLGLNKNSGEPFTGEVRADSFKGDGAIHLEWGNDQFVDNYIIMRSIDGLDGPRNFIEIYRGKSVFFVDRNVQSDIRYVYRLDKEYRSAIYNGLETTIAVGNAMGVDLNEPNNDKANATLLNSYKDANLYYYKFSDGTALSDTDWYAVKTPPLKTANIAISEVNAGIRSSFYVHIPGSDPLYFNASNTTFSIKNDSSEEYIYFEICPAAIEFVEPDMSGGTYRAYRVTVKSIADDSDNNSNDTGNNNGGKPEDNNNSGNNNGAGNNEGSGNNSGSGNTGGSGNNGGSGSDGGTGNNGGSGNEGGSGNDGGTGNTGGSGDDGGSGNNGGSGDNGGSGNDGGSGNTGGSGDDGGSGDGGGTGNTGGSGDGGGSGNNNDDPITVIVEGSELFVNDSLGRTIFYTNETKYSNNNYTFWKHISNGSANFSKITAGLVKESGYSSGGYGFFFRGQTVANFGEVMLAVLIRTGGHYAVGKVVDGVYSDIITWTPGAYLRRGYGVKNELSVEWDNDNQQYVLFINGIEQNTFVDVTEPKCAGSGAGAIAVLTSLEKFPETPVKTRYEIKHE